MQRLNDKYGRGSAVANGAGFADLSLGRKQETNILTYTSRSNAKGLNSVPIQDDRLLLMERIAYLC